MRMVNLMTWTTDKPTKPGWYWHKVRGKEPMVVQLIPAPGQYDPRKLVLYRDYDGEESWTRLSKIRGQFAGPLEIPK